MTATIKTAVTSPTHPKPIKRKSSEAEPRVGVDPVDKWVGEQIRARRHMLKMSQSTLGNALGVAFQQVQKYEKGTNRVSASMLKAIADTLECQPGDFFPLDGPGNGDAAATAGVLKFVDSSAAVRLMRAFAEIRSTSLRASIVTMVEHVSARPQS